MDRLFWYRFSADAVLLLHVAIVCFVILGPVLIVAGNMRGWRWVNALSFRATHAAAILVVIAESWVGIACPLTILEMRLRERAGFAVYDGSFIEYWLQRFLYYDFPAWAFTVSYSLFGLLVLAVWWRFPPDPWQTGKKIRHHWR
ncbi:DUF2784 domain-containing protein [Oxalobacteraceae bacterium R-40]|uniref:DUF2784 domain-containing protein n=1 Tax=Keguizhuia sedimenti TaxID=3064264 RepID=A0ABU1BJH5_9BURK|nr:DUF2784 domain-containing protein [Oxalobacteraceae bacterium R-40]